MGDDGPARLAFGAPGVPLRVGLESAPLAFALGQVLPFEQVVKIMVAVADQHGPEAERADAVPVPDAQGGFLEALLQARQASRKATVDTQLVDHGLPSWRIKSL